MPIDGRASVSPTSDVYHPRVLESFRDRMHVGDGMAYSEILCKAMSSPECKGGF